MNEEAYAAIDSTRREFRAKVAQWKRANPYLMEAQERVRAAMGYEDYRVETGIVYNKALDDIKIEDDIKIVLVADNPGKKEQLRVNNRYLVGQSGKLAEGWFARELEVNFRRDILILNKTPIHTPKTAELGALLRSAGPHRERLEALLADSQATMADLAWRLYSALRAAVVKNKNPGAPWPVLWVSGLGELRSGGLFEIYRDELSRRMAKADPSLTSGVWAFNHFSMNQFAIELKRKARAGEGLMQELGRVGAENRERVFGQ
jgi:hypothetical protein